MGWPRLCKQWSWSGEAQACRELIFPEEFEITHIDKWGSQHELACTNKYHSSRARNSMPREVSNAELRLLHSVFINNACIIALLIINERCNC